MKSENYKKHEMAKHAANLKGMFEQKTYSEEWSSMYYACLFFTPFAQVVSAALALGVPMWVGSKLFGSVAVGLAAGLITVVLFEIMKRNVVSLAAKFYYKNLLSTKLKLSVACFSIASIIASSFGTPILVRDLAPLPRAQSESEVIGAMDNSHNAYLAQLKELQSNTKAASAKIHAQNNWKGITITSARSNVLQLEQQSKSISDSIKNAITKHNSARKTALANASDLHKSAVKSSKIEIENVGWIFALVCLCFEFSFLYAIFWLYDYKYHQYCELGTTLLSKQGATKLHEAASEAPSIGFNHEGKVVKNGNKLEIICRKQNGELKAYDSSALSTNIYATTGERKEYFKKMKDKLEQSK